MTSVSLTRLPGITTCKQTAQLVNSTLTPQNIPGLSFPLLSGHRYWFKFFIEWQSAATTTGLTLVCTAPAVTSASWLGLIRQGAIGTDMLFEGGGTDVTTAITSASVSSANVDVGAWCEGIIEPSASGTLQLQAASEVDTSAITVQNVGMGILIDAG